ncbi:hypothetical protein BVRB_024250, partial [Beta vulgaris subsp. vulgaris]
RNPAPRPWSDQVAAPAASELLPGQQAPVAEQKVVFTVSKSNNIQDPPASSKVWRPDSPERYTSKIPIPASNRFMDDDEDDEDNQQSRAWSTSWRPKASDYGNDNQWDNNTNGHYSNGTGYAANGNPVTINEDEDEEGAINENEEEVDFNEEDELIAEDDDAIVDSSYEIQHEYYEEVVQSTHQPILHDATSHMDSIANAYASDSASDDELPTDNQFKPQTTVPMPVPSSPVKEPVQEPPLWNEARIQANGVKSSFSALFGDSAPSQQLLPEQPFVAQLEF